MLGDRGEFRQFNMARHKEIETREQIAGRIRGQVDPILGGQITAMQKAREAGAKESQKVAEDFEKYLDNSQVGGYKSRELFEIRLNEILAQRDKLLKAGQGLSQTRSKELGYTPDEWDKLAKSYSVEYEANPYFGKWPFLVKAEKLLEQRKGLANILEKFQEKKE